MFCVIRFPYLLQDDVSFVKTLESHGIVPSKTTTAGKPMFSIAVYGLKDVSLHALRRFMWLNPLVLFGNYLDSMSKIELLDGIRWVFIDFVFDRELFVSD